MHRVAARVRVRNLALWMSWGSVIGALAGAALLGSVDATLLSALLAAVLVLSAVRLYGLRAAGNAAERPPLHR
jgi:uncharacterized membrane protein YfcA